MLSKRCEILTKLSDLLSFQARYGEAIRTHNQFVSTQRSGSGTAEKRSRPGPMRSASRARSGQAKPPVPPLFRSRFVDPGPIRGKAELCPNSARAVTSKEGGMKPFLLAAFLPGAFLPILLICQTTQGSISGTLRDGSGAPVHGVVFYCRIAGDGSIVSRGSVPSDDNGFYAFPPLSPGEYRLRAQNEGS